MILSFSTNWNNKLNCRCFTTFRLYNPSRHYVGARFDVEFGGKVLKTVEVIALKTLRLEEVDEWMARLDTGHSREEFIRIVREMYGKIEDLDRKRFCFMLLKEI